MLVDSPSAVAAKRFAATLRANPVITPGPKPPAEPFATPPAPPAPPSPVAGLSIVAAPTERAVVAPPKPAVVEIAPVVVPPAPKLDAVAAVKTIEAPPAAPSVISALPERRMPIAPVAEIAVEPRMVPRPVATPIAAAPAPPALRDPLRHWGLREPAFENAPSTRFFYLSPEHAEALFRLRYAIQHRKGCAALIGTLGCGKTTLTRALVRELDPERFDVALLASPMETPVEFLKELLFQLGITPTHDDKPSLLRALETRLVENLRNGRDTVVIVDEAQKIDNEEIFNELRLLLNFQTNDRFLITLVLSGSDELIATLRSHPHLAQRCAVRASLEPLDRHETANYVRHRLVTAGRDAETLTEDAVDAVYAATGGTPRRINAVCDMTLLVGASKGVERVEAELVRRVTSELSDFLAASA